MTTEEPCRECGSAVYLKTVEYPRKGNEKVARTGQVRVCTNGGCITNSRRLAKPKS